MSPYFELNMNSHWTQWSCRERSWTCLTCCLKAFGSRYTFPQRSQAFYFHSIYIRTVMPCPFTGPKMFCAGPIVWLRLVPLQKLLCWHKNQFHWMQIIFLSGIGLAQKNWTSPKHFGTCKRTRHYCDLNQPMLFGFLHFIFPSIEVPLKYWYCFSGKLEFNISQSLQSGILLSPTIKSFFHSKYL